MDTYGPRYRRSLPDVEDGPLTIETIFGTRPPPPIGKVAVSQNEENAMNKRDLLEAVAPQTGNTKAAVDETLTAVLATITKKVSAGARGAVGRVR